MRGGKYVLFKYLLLLKNMQEITIIEKILFFNYVKISIKEKKYGKLAIKISVIDGAHYI